MEREKFGIYLNSKDLKVLRINSPYWIPSGEEWIYVTPEVNATLMDIKEKIKQKEINVEEEKISWASIVEYKK